MTEPLETCREWLPDTLGRATDRCGKPAVVIIWGKLFPPEALGPKCELHAAVHLPLHAISQWAVFDLRGLVRQPQPRGVGR